jgi:dienelactone hydrolase
MTLRSALLLLPVTATAACYAPLRLVESDADRVLVRHRLDAPDPSRPGPHAVQRLYYGSGTDRNRPEYRDSVTLRTDSVDASRFVDLGQAARSRNRYWGFSPRGMPLNARVWHPEGAGPFPLVLIAHGNHNMKEFSDPGYAWLGEHLASRGYIVASLDMNFINGAIRNENDARGWFFLKHLELFRRWGAEPGNPFHGRVDMANIALVGHSRGGEAVGHAAAFNRLSRYPDDGNVTFDFGFDIRSIIAIAPVDGQYQPADRLVPVEDVSYLVFHGSHDGDVTSFMGLRQYQRVAFTEGFRGFKSAVFVYRANHGQWNSVWGAKDNGPRSARILDLRALMPEEDQRRFGRVYITAFLEATLRGRSEWLPLFRDHRVAADWLPGTMYTTRFEEATFRAVASFEEDIDLTTGSVPGVTLRGDSLATWREQRVDLRGATPPVTNPNASQYNNVVTVGWNNRLAGDDSTRTGPPAGYAVELPAGLAREWRLAEGGALQFLLMPMEAVPGPRRAPRDTTAADTTARSGPGAPRASRSRRGDDEKPPIDLSIEVVDAAGTTARVTLSDYGAVRRPLESWVLRRRDVERSRFGRLSEIVLQSYTIPLDDFRRAAPGLDVSALRAVRFVFDIAPAGTVLIDDIGFARPDPAFLVAGVRDEP